ncbi:ribulose-phosphate 3-epimerase [Lysinibacter sp. HNR]|uniref:ribulose-phosphate 3-epimerase n=1 Tax=Lysinibacter sp. HNR TaxID=3031408 RepID=UPI002435D88E|nr:ribulose-phosphate 3-epimerase [Lysinibacter sp. HNR]WGD36360.1 ribulose-phosphate 3-epimerase [Lysinibacter sp. HNR]
MSQRIYPSILSADFANLETELQRISTADAAHVDVMDNHFVPNLTLGLPVAERLQQVSPIPLDIHLMIENPERWAPGYAEMGAFSVTFHAEATAEPVALARKIRQIGSRASLALKPGTRAEQYLDILGEFDQILVMTVEPGFGGQKFMADTMPKLRLLNDARKRLEIDVWLQVDGGITADTITAAAEAGADTFVAGSSVFGGVPADNIATLREAVRAHGGH